MSFNGYPSQYCEMYRDTLNCSIAFELTTCDSRDIIHFLSDYQRYASALSLTLIFLYPYISWTVFLLFNYRQVWLAFLESSPLLHLSDSLYVQLM